MTHRRLLQPALRLAALLTVLAVVGSRAAADAPAGRGADGIAYSAVAVPAEEAAKHSADAKKEMEKFQGTWTAVSITQNGENAVPDDDLKNLRLAINGDSRTLTIGDEVRSRATFTLDPAQSPKAIDITVSEGSLKGRTLRGIYAIDGDTHTICLALQGDERPKELTSKEGSGHL